MWKNKHIVVAMLIAPVLAILAWFAVDSVVAERPHVAKPGAAYPLVARSNCRYQSGRCDLENSDFRLSLERVSDAGSVAVRLSSRFALSEANVAIGSDPAALDRPVAFVPADETGYEWRMPLTIEPGEKDMLRLAVIAGQSAYYAETPAVFLGPTNR